MIYALGRKLKVYVCYEYACEMNGDELNYGPCKVFTTEESAVRWVGEEEGREYLELETED